MRGGSQAAGALFQHLRATALTFASVANGVALALGASQTLRGDGEYYFYALNICSFVLMARFWWRYAIFSYYAPSRFIDQYVVDFAIAAIGIFAVFFFNQPDRWALLYFFVYLLAAVKVWRLGHILDPASYRRREDYLADLNLSHRKIRKYLVTAAAFGLICLFFYVTGNNKIWVLLCASILLVVFFINIWKKVRHGFVVPKWGVALDPTAFQYGKHEETRRAKKIGRVKS
jgi:hypothetical protein